MDALRSACLTVVAIGVAIAVVFGVVRWIGSRYVEVQEGYAVPVKWLGRHVRLLCPGPHLRWPGEKPGRAIETRPRDAILPVKAILTHKGLPVTVSLRYRLSFVPANMSRAELYYPQDEWEQQQRRVFTDGLQRVVEEFPRPFAGRPLEATTLATVFSPFFSNPPFVLSRKLEQRVVGPLAALGINLLPDTLIIDRLDPPLDVTNAYQQMLQSGFEANASSRFVQAIRACAPDISALELASLYSSVVNNVNEVRTVFDGSTFRPGSYFAGVGGSTTPPPLPEPALLASPAPSIGSAPGTDPAVATDQSYRLTAEDMALLKRL